MPPRNEPTGNSLFPPPQAPASTPTGEAKPRASATQSAWISAHCDGGARGNPGPAGYGALVQSADGSILAELSEFLGLRTNNFAEYSGLLGCLEFALQHGYRKLRVVSDSELMVKQIQGKYQVKSPDLKLLYDEAKRRIAQLDGFEISHALRHKNKDADRLANEAMDRGMNRSPDRAPSSPALAKPAPAPPPTPAKASTPAIPIARPDRPAAPPPSNPPGAMLRGFTRDGVVHILGGTKLPDGVFVKVILE